MEADLDTHPTYDALSYVWGTPNPETQDSIAICVSPGIHDSLSITRNCGQALRHMRLQTEARAVWVDAICINQALNVEKSHQVQMMDNVYSRAHNVIVWLHLTGFTAEEYRRAFLMAERMAASVEKGLLCLVEDEEDTPSIYSMPTRTDSTDKTQASITEHSPLENTADSSARSMQEDGEAAEPSSQSLCEAYFIAKCTALRGLSNADYFL